MVDQVRYTNKLYGKRILIVGGSSGIGYAVAEATLENGCHVFICSSNQERVDAAVMSLRSSYPTAQKRIAGYAYSMSDQEKLESNISELFEQCGQLDHVVYTAGNNTPATTIENASVETILSPFTVRYTALVLVAKYATKALARSPHSSITMTTGTVTEKPIPNWSVIAGPRAAVLALSKGLALDLRPIRVNTICVGAVNTNIWAALSEEQRNTTMAALVEKSTTGRIAQASDVAEAYVYCMKDINITGSVIHSNGGTLLV